jgi:sugar lactone lactonase YvrE
MRLFRSLPLALTLMLGLSVLSCAVPPAPQLQQSARMGSAKFTLVPHVTEATFTQALVTRPTAASIARLEVFPLVETSPGNYQPMKADGSPTVLGDTEAIRITQNSPDLRLGRPIELTGLAPNTRYRILARAYDADGKLLSVDATSRLDVNVTDDDALLTPVLPVMLADVPFAAATTITLDNAAEAFYATVETQLVTVAGGVETPVDGTTQTLSKAQIPLALKLDGLRADTLYRLKAVLRDSENAQVAAASVEIAVANDDAPSGKTLAMAARPKSILAGAYPTVTADLQDGSGTAARLNEPIFLARDAAGDIYFAEWYNHGVRKVTPAGVVSTVAGPSTPNTSGFVDGPASSARFKEPNGIAIDAAGNIYITEYGNHAIRMIPKTSGTYFGKPMTAGEVATIAGNGTAGTAGGSLSDARFNTPLGIAVDKSGNLYISEWSGYRIRMIVNQSGTYFGKAMTANEVYTLAGTGTPSSTDGPLDSATFSTPGGIALDDEGNLYIIESSGRRVRMIVKQSGTYFGKPMTGNQVNTLAGSGLSGFQDGALDTAQFRSPAGITVDDAGNVYVGDTFNHAIRMIPKESGTYLGKAVTANQVTTIVGAPPTIAIAGYQDGSPSNARLNHPWGVLVDASGSLYVADTLNHAIRVFR